MGEAIGGRPFGTPFPIARTPGRIIAHFETLFFEAIVSGRLH
jgi:hypothetical protein